jgi:hypothetical protein
VEIARQKAYRKTFDLACSELAALSIEGQTAKAGLAFSKKADAYSIPVPFFDETIELGVPGFSFASAKGSNVTLTTRIIILHYLIHASGSALGTGLVPYEDIPGCRTYLPVFERRVVKPLVAAFGFDRDTFIEAGRALGGRQEEYGNASFTLAAFPRLPITLILWEGEEDFPPSVKVLFDKSIHTYVPLEDIVVISKMAATRLLKAARRAHVGE